MARTITFAQQKGGAGKTTLLAQLAVEFAREAPVALIDLDPQKTLAGWMDERIRRRGEADFDLIESSEWRIGVDIRRAARDAELILVDCPGAADISLNRVLRESDLVIAPAQPSAPDIWATRATLRAALREGVEACVAFNRAPPRGGAVEEMAARLRDEGVDLLEARVGNRVAFSAAFARGAAASEIARGAKAAAEIAALANEIRGRLGQPARP